MTPSRPPRGSRKHVLDLTAQPDFPAQMQALLAEVPVAMGTSDRWMPRGHAHPREARLETFGPAWLPGHPAWPALSTWWLAHRRGANTPNWDLAIGCRIEDKPGLVLVEAKANEPEMSASGKRLSRTASAASRDNHRRIGEALEEATSALSRGGRMIVYGPFMRGSSYASEGDRAFDASLRGRDPDIGYKSVENVSEAAVSAGFIPVATDAMPANNLLPACWRLMGLTLVAVTTPPRRSLRGTTLTAGLLTLAP